MRYMTDNLARGEPALGLLPPVKRLLGNARTPSDRGQRHAQVQLLQNCSNMFRFELLLLHGKTATPVGDQFAEKLTLRAGQNRVGRSHA